MLEKLDEPLAKRGLSSDLFSKASKYLRKNGTQIKKDYYFQVLQDVNGLNFDAFIRLIHNEISILDIVLMNYVPKEVFIDVKDSDRGISTIKASGVYEGNFPEAKEAARLSAESYLSHFIRGLEHADPEGVLGHTAVSPNPYWGYTLSYRPNSSL